MLDWMTDGVAEIRRSLLEDAPVGDSPTHPPFAGGWWKLRMVAAKNEDGTHRTEGCVKLSKKSWQICLRILPGLIG